MTLARRNRQPFRLRATLPALAATLLGSMVAFLPASAEAAPVPDCTAVGIDVTPLGGPNFYIDGSNTVAFRSSYTGYRVTNDTGASTADLWLQLSDFTGGALGLASGQSAAQRVGSLAAGEAGSRFWYLTATGESETAQRHTITVYSHNPGQADSIALCGATGGFSSVQGTINANSNKVTGITVSGGAPKLGARFTVTVTGDTGTIGAGIANDAESLWMSPAVDETWPADAFRLVGTSLAIDDPDQPGTRETYTDILRVADLGPASRSYTASYTFQAVGFTSAATTVQPVQEIASGTQVKHTGSYPATIPAISPPVNDLTVAAATTPTRLDLGGGDGDLDVTVAGTAGAELDSFDLALPADATVVPGRTTWDGQPTHDPVTTSGRLLVPGPFVVGAGKHLRVRLHFGPTPGHRPVGVVGVVGPARIGTTTAEVDGSNPADGGVDVDTAPTAPDREAWTSGSPLTYTASDLARDVDGDPLTFTAVGDPRDGRTELTDGVLTYTPGGSADDSFTYAVSDGRGGEATGTVTVHPGNVPAPTEEPTPTDEPTPNDQPSSPPAPQTLGFTLPSTLLGTDGYSLAATSTSGLAVHFTVSEGDCEIVDGVLVPSAAGACTVTATQDGGPGWAPATAVSRTVAFLAPVDDLATVRGGQPVTLDVTANDPTGVTLDSVDTPSHGTATTTGGRVVYRPAASFRGTESFDYRVVKDGRRARAHISVTVTNLPPTVTGRNLEQQAGTTRTVSVLASDPNGDPLSVTAVPADPRVTVTVVDGGLRVTPGAGVSGTVPITVTVRDDAGGSASTTFVDTITPPAPAVAARTLSGDGTTVTWAAAPTSGAGYEVVIGGKPACQTTATACLIPRLVGRGLSVRIRTLGRDGTTSELTPAPLHGHGKVLVATVYFDSAKAALKPAAKKTLTRAVRMLRGSGFGTVSLDGYTDSDGGVAYNMALSHRRALAVSAFLHDRVPVRTTESWHGKSGAAATNATSHGKSLNRRVELVVRY